MRPARTKRSVSGGSSRYRNKLRQNHDNVRRHALDEAVDIHLTGERAGWIVWVGDEYQARLGRDGSNDPIEIMAKIGARHFDGAGAENGGDQLVGDEGMLGGDDVVAAMEEGVAEKLDDFIRATTEDDVIAGETQFCGERFA